MAESSSQNRSVYRLRWVGYGLLVFAFIDLLQILIPVGFTNPAWEFATVGAIVERVAVPLLGLALVFFGEFYDRAGFEKIPLRILSWLCLLLAVLFILLIPLGVVSTLKLKSTLEQQANAPAMQLQQARDQINQSKPEDIKTLANRMKGLGIEVDADNPDKLKAQLLERIEKVGPQISARTQAELSQKKFDLFKNATKFSLGALIAGTLFFLLWKSTDWAR